MELCRKCKRMTAEKNHYTGEIVCYNRFCDEEAKQTQSFRVEVILSPQVLTKEKDRDKILMLE